MNLPPFELTGKPLPRPYKRPVEHVVQAAEPAVASPSLVHPERTVEIADGLLLTPETIAGESRCLPFRHSGWERDRARVLDAMEHSGQPRSRIKSFNECGGVFWVLEDRASSHGLKVVPHRCHDRFCEPCGHERVEDVRRNLSELLTDQPHRFLTLTIQSTDESLHSLLDHLLASFRRLRQTAWWTKHVVGGAAFLEIKHNPAKNRWHPHLHIIVTGKFMPQKQLSERWRVASKGSFIVDIRLVRSRHELLQYATKYVTKPLPKSVRFLPAKLQETIVALKGRKLIITFGTWSRWQLTKRNTIGDWTCLGTIWTLERDAAAGDARAIEVLDILRTDATIHQIVGLDDVPET